MIAIRSRLVPVSSSAASAPTVAEGRVDRIVTGWMKLSYSTPSTMYITSTAARISHSVEESEPRKASAAPWKRDSMLAGRPISVSAASIAVTASPSDTPGARLNEIVVAGNWPMWLRSSALGRSSTRAMPASGTGSPLAELTRMRPNASGPSWNCGSASSTTRYWLAWVKMVEIWRWPKASYSASAMSAALMPRRAAAVRSISSQAWLPCSARSLATSSSCGCCCRCETSRGVHSASASMSGLDRLNWYWVRLMRSSIDNSCTGCRYSAMPGTLATRWRRRSITSSAPASRSAFGLSSISMRPVLRVELVPSTPMKDDRLATSGSSSTTSASACWRCAMAWNETDCGASLMPWIRPASCSGKKPFGTATYSATVSASVATVASSISGWRFSTQVRVRS